MKSIFICLSILILISCAGKQQMLEVGTFNIEWFPCKDDGAYMKEYGIELRWPPKGDRTDISTLFSLLEDLDIELLAVQEIVDPVLLRDSAKIYLGEQFEVIYAEAKSSQKVGFLYDSSVLELIGEQEIYSNVALGPDSYLRPAFRAFFRYKNGGYDFHAISVHLKSSPRGWKQREKQWVYLDEILSTLPEKSGDGDIILLGDFNNVSERGTAEFDEIMAKLGFYRLTAEKTDISSNFWQPDWQVERIQGSLIDHIFISANSTNEYIKNSLNVAGMCAENADEYKGEEIPDFYNRVSDHCPIYGSFRADQDDD